MGKKHTGHRNFCPDCGSTVFSSNLESFPGAIFATVGSLDNPAGIEPYWRCSPSAA